MHALDVAGTGVLPSTGTMTPAEITRACEGDEELLEGLVGELLPVIRLEVTYGLQRRAASHGRDARQDVDDFVQDVLVSLLAGGGRRLRAWDPDRGRSLRSFVRLLTRRRISRILEGYRGNPWEGGAAEEADLVEERAVEPERLFARVLSRQQLEQLMARLRARFNERSQLLFELLYVEQRPVAEVCDTMDMTRAAVDQWNVRLRQLVRKLADALDREPIGAPTGKPTGRTVGER
ncbi:sigma-70 family RNA polymerase sigma factor [Paraliomyxa miuraensis]|uniref:sigma-70 family RNA polymerase sigma factor n=1 Tax=Paraliomyxa miuraensis TaxID=376150 RepID=UPI002251C44E|nr:sigma-70 family RNA polymerase sigma factor [Paraliomyxa miuraensis]MCX4244790.1 sigma-70 family RNA polymerase sigma factor [Paraliomyxa miuraensis]